MKNLKYLMVAMLFVLASCAGSGNFKSSVSDTYTNKTSYVVMGLGGNAFGKGMHNLAPKINADVYSRHKGNDIYADIVTKARLGKLKRPLVLVGHSMGGGVVAQVASRLCSKNKIRVDYMVIIDSPKKPKVASCVGIVDQFVTTGGGIGKRLDRGNYFVIPNVRHVPLGNHPTVHKRIVKVRRSL